MEYICGVAWLAIMVVLGSGYWLIVQDEQAEWEQQKKKTKK
jgi:Tfp pilus assembly protein PilO